jgi:hypothetical protein
MKTGEEAPKKWMRYYVALVGWLVLLILFLFTFTWYFK